MKREDISIDLLRQLLRYEPETGKLFWLPRDVSLFSDDASKKAVTRQRWWNGLYANKEVRAFKKADGHFHMSIFGIRIYAHRVCWALHHGKWPVGVVDHINGNASDNKITNLRDVSPSDNMRNKPLLVTNYSGCHGVSWYKPLSKWVAHIKVGGKRKHLGYFTRIEDAISVRKVAERKAGYHPNHGRAA